MDLPSLHRIKSHTIPNSYITKCKEWCTHHISYSTTIQRSTSKQIQSLRRKSPAETNVNIRTIKSNAVYIFLRYILILILRDVDPWLLMIPFMCKINTMISPLHTDCFSDLPNFKVCCFTVWSLKGQWSLLCLHFQNYVTKTILVFNDNIALI